MFLISQNLCIARSNTHNLHTVSLGCECLPNLPPDKQNSVELNSVAWEFIIEAIVVVFISGVLQSDSPFTTHPVTEHVGKFEGHFWRRDAFAMPFLSHRKYWPGLK